MYVTDKMADPSKNVPQPFNSSLFGSAGGSSLSFDLDTSAVSAPFVIGPVSKGKEGAPQSSSTPPQTRKDSPSGALFAEAKTRPVQAAASLFPTTSSGSSSASFNPLLSYQPDPLAPGPISTQETELETVDLGSPTVEPPSKPQPLLPPAPADNTPLRGPPASSGPPLMSSQPQLATVPLQTTPEVGGGGGEESNPYRLSARHMGRPVHQAVAPPTQAPFLSSNIMPPAPPPTSMENLGIPPPTSSSASGYSPILPPPTSGGYQGVSSQMSPPMYYTGGAAGVYQPVRPHWFYLRSGDKYWTPFTLVDSSR